MLNLFAPINHLGVGVHSYQLAKAYTDLGNDVCLVPPFGSLSFQDSYVTLWTENRAKFSAHDPSLMIFDLAFLSQFSGTPRVGFAVFETDGFTPTQMAAMKSCDFLLTPSAWGKNVLQSHGLASEVVNEGVDLEVFPVTIPRESGVFRFLHVGKLEERKGTMQLLRCFFNALEKKDAELILHCENPFMKNGGRDEIVEFLTQIGFRPGMDVFRRAGLTVKLTSHKKNIADLYWLADCGVFPTRGEGWGLPIHECIASGVPTIVGCWSGQSEYLGGNYPHELTFERSMNQAAYDGVWFHADRGNWHVVDDEDLINRILWAYENSRAFRKSEKWANAVLRAREFTWERAARQLEAFISKVK